MSPTSYQTAPPRDDTAESRAWTGTGFIPPDFKSGASANSAIPAGYGKNVIIKKPQSQEKNIKRFIFLFIFTNHASWPHKAKPNHKG